MVWFMIYASEQTDRQTDRQSDILIIRGKVIKL